MNQTRRKKGEVIKKVLQIVGAGLVVGTIIAFPPLAMSFNLIMEVIEEREQKISKAQVKRVLYNLEKKKLISLKKNNGDLLATFNEKGKKLILKYKFDELKIKKPKKWDGKWRLVMFDIPEKRKRARETLRRKLKSMDFYQVQKSVFIHPFECQREIESVTTAYEIEPFVYFMRADYIDNEKKIKTKFDLP